MWMPTSKRDTGNFRIEYMSGATQFLLPGYRSFDLSPSLSLQPCSNTMHRGIHNYALCFQYRPVMLEAMANEVVQYVKHQSNRWHTNLVILNLEVCKKWMLKKYRDTKHKDGSWNKSRSDLILPWMTDKNTESDILLEHCKFH